MASPEFHLTYVGLSLIGVLIAHTFQIFLNRSTDRAKKSRTVPKTVRQFVNPKSPAKKKFPIFLSLFAIFGVLEAYLIYIRNVDPGIANLISGFLVIMAYMLMWALFGRHNEQLYLLIIMGGFFISIFTFYGSAWIFTKGEVSFWPFQ